MMKYIVMVLMTIVLLSGCMDPTISKNTFAWDIEAEGEWTLQIDAEYSDGWKTHLISGDGDEQLRLAPIIGTDQKQWVARFTRDVRAEVIYRGDEVYDDKLKEGKKIKWP